MTERVKVDNLNKDEDALALRLCIKYQVPLLLVNTSRTLYYHVCFGHFSLTTCYGQTCPLVVKERFGWRP